MSPTRRRLRIRSGVELVVDVMGSAQAPAVVLVSGAGAPAAFWPEPFVERLASRGFTVVRYDHRDTGGSTHFDEPYEIDALLDDLQQLLVQLDHDRVHLVAHSMGGYLVQMAACAGWPELVSITSISAGSAVDEPTRDRLGMSPPSDATWTVLMKNQPTGHFEHDLPGWLESWRFLNGSLPFDERSATAYTRALYEGDPRNAQVAVHHVHAMSTVPSTLAQSLPQIRLPTLVLHGTEDPLVPIDHGRATARLVPGSTFGALPGAGHMFFDTTAWHEIGEWIEGHLSKNRAT